jgi:hypothetical protein
MRNAARVANGWLVAAIATAATEEGRPNANRKDIEVQGSHNHRK